jgi:hypothetical protein
MIPLIERVVNRIRHEIAPSLLEAGAGALREMATCADEIAQGVRNGEGLEDAATRVIFGEAAEAQEVEYHVE